jgi:KUP system potassium uptake protein
MTSVKETKCKLFRGDPVSDTTEQPSPNPHSDGTHPPKNLAKLVLGCIGVVYGDIGTSPLYAMRESLHAASYDGLTRGDVIGVISLLIWTLILIVTVKYILLIMRADNRGEGGTLSLVALVQQALKKRPGWLLTVGVIGISLFFGDAMITPAMSVLSAVEGMSLVTPAFQPYVVPVTVLIILMLFLMQSQGTERVSIVFGPIMVVWFLSMAAMGIWHVGDDPEIFKALNPRYGAFRPQADPARLGRTGLSSPGAVLSRPRGAGAEQP